MLCGDRPCRRSRVWAPLAVDTDVTMRSRTFLCLLALCCVVSRPGAAPLFGAQTSPPPASSSLVDDDARKQIRELKLKAIDALNAGDLKKELDAAEADSASRSRRCAGAQSDRRDSVDPG